MNRRQFVQTITALLGASAFPPARAMLAQQPAIADITVLGIDLCTAGGDVDVIAVLAKATADLIPPASEGMIDLGEWRGEVMRTGVATHARVRTSVGNFDMLLDLDSGPIAASVGQHVVLDAKVKA